VDLADVVGRTGQVVLDELSTLHHGNLRDAAAHADTHEVAPDGLPTALASAASLQGVLVELQAGAVGNRLDWPVALPLATLLVRSPVSGGLALAAST
jgi:hypothetical protein